MKRGVVGVLVLGIALASAAPARADNQQTAQALFDEGRRLMQANQYSEACPKFAESQRLDPGAGTLLNLALCYEKNEQLATAWITYTQAVEDADRSGRQEWAKRAKDKATALAPHLTSITIAVPKAARVDGLEVTRDGEKVNTAGFGVKVPVDGGDHVIEATAPGKETWTHHVTAPARDGNLTVTVPPLAAAKTEVTPAPVTPKKEPATKGGTQRTLGIVVGVIGIAGLGVGTGFAIRAAGKHSDAKKDCNAAETECGPNGLSEYSAAKSSANIATIGVIAGAAFVLGGVVLYLTAPKGTVTPSALLDAGRGWTF